MLKEKIISQLLDPSRGFSSVLETSQNSVKSNGSTPLNFSNVVGNFQIGGFSKTSGDYLVGENGPEIVKLPKGSAVIPLNIKDLIEGLKNLPELADFIEGDEVELFGDPSNPSIMSGNKGKVSLNKLQEKYEELIDESGKNKSENSKLISQLEEQMGILKDLKSIGEKKISDSIEKIEFKKEEIIKNYSYKEIGEYQDLAARILNSISKEHINPLTSAKVDLLAAKAVSIKNELKSKETGESVISGSIKSNKPEDIKSLAIENKLGELKEMGPGVYKKSLEVLSKGAPTVIPGTELKDLTKVETGKEIKQESSNDILKIFNNLIQSKNINSELGNRSNPDNLINSLDSYRYEDSTNVKSTEGVLNYFKNGGVAVDSGRYLVGENGPEIVKSPISPTLTTPERIDQSQSTKVPVGLINSSPEIIKGAYGPIPVRNAEPQKSVNIINIPQNTEKTAIPKSAVTLSPNFLSENKIPVQYSSLPNAALGQSKTLLNAIQSTTPVNSLIEPKYGIQNTPPSIINPQIKELIQKQITIQSASAPAVTNQVPSQSSVLKEVLNNPRQLNSEIKSSVTPLVEYKKEVKPSLTESIDKLKTGLEEAFKKNTNTPASSVPESSSISPASESSDLSLPKTNSPENKKSAESDNSQKELQENLTDIKTLLMRISMLLEGPLEVSSVDSPFRPDSRKV